MVSISTGNLRGTVTDANVSITISGTTGNTGMSLLCSHSLLSSSLISSKADNNFNRGFTYVFGMEDVDGGEIQKDPN